ncbi:MAG TPA: hypothetical protein VKY19_18680, partial [Ktedonosporobacter sp.]|nr:hypothetical protein [Ktedonosporobacter sp.]
MSITVRHTASSALPMDEGQYTLPQAIDLGAHHLLLNSDQSIELMRAAQGQAEPAYVLCLDATEAYRLMQCLNDLFKQTSN